MATSKAEILAEIMSLDMTQNNVIYLGKMRIAIPRAKSAEELIDDWRDDAQHALRFKMLKRTQLIAFVAKLNPSQSYVIGKRPAVRIERCRTRSEEIERRMLLLLKRFKRAPATAFKGLT